MHLSEVVIILGLNTDIWAGDYPFLISTEFAVIYPACVTLKSKPI